MKFKILIAVLIVASGCSYQMEGEKERREEQAKLMAIQNKEVERQKKEAQDLERQKYHDSRFQSYEVK